LVWAWFGWSRSKKKTFGVFQKNTGKSLKRNKNKIK
jgi:hypothetical protein